MTARRRGRKTGRRLRCGRLRARLGLRWARHLCSRLRRRRLRRRFGITHEDRRSRGKPAVIGGEANLERGHAAPIAGRRRSAPAACHGAHRSPLAQCRGTATRNGLAKGDEAGDRGPGDVSVRRARTCAGVRLRDDAGGRDLAAEDTEVVDLRARTRARGAPRDRRGAGVRGSRRDEMVVIEASGEDHLVVRCRGRGRGGAPLTGDDDLDRVCPCGCARCVRLPPAGVCRRGQQERHDEEEPHRSALHHEPPIMQVPAGN